MEEGIISFRNELQVKMVVVSMENYRNNDDQELYDTVIEEFSINHRKKSITFKKLKPISRKTDLPIL
ncbi:hypothetical protein [Neobacillus terrae]|uniref:hypothetical protein n=1 Tax=Neobacillus terrae TaxID=3034837 RepID=UPI001407440F|nr:hypothetical protein [Neobacillus terrae]NHM33423.1 hypothetical protein [Neobacillus terrae]